MSKHDSNVVEQTRWSLTQFELIFQSFYPWQYVRCLIFIRLHLCTFYGGGRCIIHRTAFIFRDSWNQYFLIVFFYCWDPLCEFKLFNFLAMWNLVPFRQANKHLIRIAIRWGLKAPSNVVREQGFLDTVCFYLSRQVRKDIVISWRPPKQQRDKAQAQTTSQLLPQTDSATSIPLFWLR